MFASLSMLLVLAPACSDDVPPGGTIDGASADAAASEGGASTDGGVDDTGAGDGAPSGDSATPSGDSATPSGDSATPSGDSATPSGDSAAPSDSGVPAADSGTPVADSGAPTADAPAPTADSGTPASDAPVATADSGTPASDAPVVSRDSGIPTSDAPVVTTDSAPPADAAVPDAPPPAPTAFRINSLALADPHAYLTGCSVDITGLLNALINTEITGDADNNNVLDLSYVIVFRPLTQGATTTGATVEIAEANCAAPHPPSTCTRTLSSQPTLASAGYSNQSSGTCLGRTVNGTDVTDHTPTTTIAPCFVSQPRDLTITVSGVPIRLRDARIAGGYNSTPATGLTRGLVRGFITQADAAATVLPASVPLVGGRTLASLLCAAGNNNESDVHPTHGAGWWFFLEYTAGRVTYTEN